MKEIFSKFTYIVLGVLTAVYSALSYVLVWEKSPIIYHDPIGYYLFALFPVLVIAVLYAPGFLITLWFEGARPARSISKEEVLVNVFLYSLFTFFLFNVLWGEHIGTFLLSALSVAAGLGSTYAAPESRVFAWAQKNENAFMLGFIFLALILPISILTYTRVFISEPKTPFELRGETLSCQTNEDCGNFDCTGYNIGAWYCDTDGYPGCDFEKSICTCHISCL